MKNSYLNISDLEELRKLIFETINELEEEDPESIDPEGIDIIDIDDDGNIIPRSKKQDS
tara:strand:- start:1027 stop:1203 length:177 start_codon:yes stop_codon:yes gene_type:complete